MADVTSSLIGISINSINSWPAAATWFPSCPGMGDRDMSSMPVLGLSTGAQLVWVLLRVHLTKNNRLFFLLLLHLKTTLLHSRDGRIVLLCGRVGRGGIRAGRKQELRQQTEGLEKSDVSTEGTNKIV